MKLLVGLGNPGKEYEHNRHNIGFMFVEHLIQKTTPGVSFSLQSKFKSMIAETQYNGEKYIVAEPQTFMNRSGESLTRLAQFYKITPDNIIVAHDDLDIFLGKYKVQMANGPKQHNGLASIEQLFGTPNFWRVRIGVENRNEEFKVPGETYVLQNFTDEEKSTLPTTFDKIIEQMKVQKVI